MLELTRRETDLLEQLLRAAGRAVVKDVLEERHVLVRRGGDGQRARGGSVAPAQAVGERRGRASAIETKRGIGYRLVVGEDA